MEESNPSDVVSEEQFQKKLKEAGWPVKFGSAIMISSGIITGNLFNNYYRTICRMGKAFRMTTFLPAALVCPLFGGLSHAAEVNRLIKRKTIQLECPVCYEIKSGLNQLFSGGIYPLLLSYLCCTGLVRKHQPENLRKIGMLDTTSRLSQFKMILPKRLALSLLVCNFAIGTIVAQLELRSLIDQMKEKEEKIEMD